MSDGKDKLRTKLAAATLSQLNFYPLHKSKDDPAPFVCVTLPEDFNIAKSITDAVKWIFGLEALPPTTGQIFQEYATHVALLDPRKQPEDGDTILSPYKSMIFDREGIEMLPKANVKNDTLYAYAEYTGIEIPKRHLAAR